MNTENTDQQEKMLGIMYCLQEFYTNQEMLTFYNECDEYDQDIEEAFLWLKSETDQCVEKFGSTPIFRRLRDRFAEMKNWKTLRKAYTE